ncbi:MAG: glucose 1-dehydrogenase [Candidatus Pelagadaptatus aseana]|uniref:SDR family NAD(P)-dependent oxidoreductase n=1 Tax=Candidatus Pelagadaptatus aseana TaxID=3120508 RepID=UPI0039B235AE
MDPLLDFTGKVVLITGAASGFGAQLAEEFSKRGAKLVLGDINEPGLEAVASNLPGDATTVLCDVSHERDCQAMVEAAVEIYGRLDIAINNAGGGHPMGSIHTLTEDIMDQQFALNTKGVMFGMKHQIAQMLKQEDGTILNVSSMAGLGASPKIGAYGAAKHAVIGLTKTAAVEYAKKGIRVNAVCPFFALTPLVTDSVLGESQDFLKQGAPMKRLGETEEITNLMVMLCSPGNSYMTGQAIAIDGGVSAL